jgi:hypothetical protein
MSQFMAYQSQHHPSQMHQHSSHNHHGGRSRRAPRISASHQRMGKQMQMYRTPKESYVEPPSITAFRRGFEAARSFDLEDDEVFCPFHLLTEDDVSSVFCFHPISLSSQSTWHRTAMLTSPAAINPLVRVRPIVAVERLARAIAAPAPAAAHP